MRPPVEKISLASEDTQIALTPGRVGRLQEDSTVRCATVDSTAIENHSSNIEVLRTEHRSSMYSQNPEIGIHGSAGSTIPGTKARRKLT